MIRHILFDLGVVLVHLDYPRALAEIRALCPPEGAAELARFFTLDGRDPAIAAYERGELSAEAFYRHFVAHTGFRGDFARFRAIWLGIFSANEPMIALGRELARRYDIYILTNTCDLHVPAVYDALPSLRFFKGSVASWELGVLKPDPAFYERALAAYGLRREQCLFIDDRPENVRGAEACGLRSIRYTTAAETTAAIRAALGEEPAPP